MSNSSSHLFFSSVNKMDAVQLYSKFNNFQQALNNAVLEKKIHLLKFKPNENLIELGCGNGESTKSLLKYIPNNFKQYVATDKLESMLTKARTDLEQNQTITFKQLDLTDKNLDKNLQQTFDKAFSFLALHWINEDQQNQTFENINSLLQINGYAFISLAADSPVFESYMKIYDNPKWTQYMQHKMEFCSPYHKFKNDRMLFLNDMLIKNQFEILDIELMDVVYHFRTAYEFKNSIKAVNPFISRIPNELQNAYWEDLWKVHETLSDVLVTGNLPTTLIFIYAKKIQDVKPL